MSMTRAAAEIGLVCTVRAPVQFANPGELLLPLASRVVVDL